MSRSEKPEIDYKTHILIGIRANGAMSVITYSDRVPHQREVEGKASATRELYVKFLLCTPTSIMATESL